ncbi:MAG TPA: hypothetical protein VMT81_02350 [Candidatus Paceibacterota bacterium]|nr:hypothetical protein [Candidatus Paceibacterota bacterium]
MKESLPTGYGPGEHEPMDPALAPDELFEKEELRALIEKRIGHFHGKNQQEVARRLFLEGESPREVADALGITTSRVSDIQRKLITMIGRFPGEIKPYFPKEEEGG